MSKIETIKNTAFSNKKARDLTRAEILKNVFFVSN